MIDQDYYVWRQRVWDTKTRAQLDRVAEDFHRQLTPTIDADQETILDYIAQRAVVLGA